ncbi:MAG TPA: chemotaxis protein CheX [Bryobacteraceae bacterium]|jgi:chemotaxis protein CheX|nr:chemotaxis protein CheX [Bryobacteraceae bacterium]
MNLHEMLAESITAACREVFSAMLGVEIERGQADLENTAPDANDGVVSLVGLAGSWTGTGSVACSPAVACRICSHFLLTEFDAVNEEVLDAVAELTNIIIGSVKTDLEQQLGPLGISIPTVIYGRNFKTRSMGAQWTTVRFNWDGAELLVRMALAPTQPSSHARTYTAVHAWPPEL